MWSRIIILRIDICKYLFLSKQYFAWQPWKCFKSAWIWLWKKVKELCGQDAANHARFWWSTIRHPYKFPQPAQMVFHSGSHCDGNLLRCFFWMLERNYTCMPNASQCGKCPLATSAAPEYKIRVQWSMRSPQKDFLGGWFVLKKEQRDLTRLPDHQSI